MNHSTPLTIYSASAGSGKTFNLVQKYLQLLFCDQGRPTHFSKIVAMTFTNKAAWEMKERIIQALDLLAFPDRLNKDEEAKRKVLLQITALNSSRSPEEIEKKSRLALIEILHRYEEFQVLTIDKFSLRLIRSFARDLDIHEDFEVVLNEKELIETVVDELLSKMGNPSYQEITELAVNFAKSNLDEGEKWNFRRQLITFASILSNENDQPYIEKILQKKFTPEVLDLLVHQRKEKQAEFFRIKSELNDFFVSLNCNSSDFPQGNRGMYGFLSKSLPSLDLNSDIKMTNYIEKTISGEIVKEKHNVPEELRERVNEFFKKAIKLKDQYFLISTLRKNFHNLALLKYIAAELTEIKERDNIVRISEFNKMISDLLSEESASYIYERIGTRFENYLLDEFQDTSRLQMLNLLPLLHNSIAENKDNFIVGDPKQAIYRFRNGLVEQFAALPSIFNPEKDPQLSSISNFFETMGEKKSLIDNWRSRKNIVAFNNAFFPRAVTFLPLEFQNYYADVKQNAKGKDGGYVGIQLAELKRNEDKFPAQEDFILTTIRKCEKDGFKRGDICILARTGKDGMRWAKALTQAEENYKVVSADSLTVSSDKTVKLFIDYLFLRRNAANRTNQIKFTVNLLALKGQDPLVYLEEFWKNQKVGQLDFDRFVKSYFTKEDHLFFAYENLYDLGQQFAHLIEVNELFNPYVHHLMEMFQNYDVQYGPDLRGFIDFWETKGKKETVQMPENDEAIQIMTAHKAKGLEFPVVILPDVDWDFSKVKDAHFIDLKEQQELIYTNLVKESAPDFVIKEYENERNQMMLDEFNLLYVVLTRPVDRLYLQVNSKLPSKSTTVSSTSHIAFQAIQNMITENKLTAINELFYEFGVEEKKENNEQRTSFNFYPEDITNLLWFPDISLQDDNALNEEDLNLDVQFGRALHLVLAETKLNDDIHEKVQQLVQSDMIEAQFQKQLEVKLKSIHAYEPYVNLLKDATSIENETTIIVNDKEVVRPDMVIFKNKSCVVVDFKSGKERSSHYTQIKSYMKCFEEMGYNKVEGVIFYTAPLELKYVD